MTIASAVLRAVAERSGARQPCVLSIRLASAPASWTGNTTAAPGGGATSETDANRDLRIGLIVAVSVLGFLLLLALIFIVVGSAAENERARAGLPDSRAAGGSGGASASSYSAVLMVPQLNAGEEMGGHNPRHAGSAAGDGARRNVSGQGAARTGGLG